MSNADIGLIGLGTMGAALSLNIADNGFDIAVFNRTTSVTNDFVANAGSLADRVTGTETLKSFVAALKSPRAIILMVPAGDPVDQQIAALRPLLDPQDMIIDAGNANFHDTNRRAADAVGHVAMLCVTWLTCGRRGHASRHGPRSCWRHVAMLRATRR